jgi:hypothetical protein
MEAAYRSGTTMQIIADEYGITRARVQQILARRGVDSEAGRGARREARQHHADQSVTAFWNEHGTTVAALAEDGATKAEVLDRFRLTHPSVDLEAARAALAASEVVFSKNEDALHFPDSALRFGVLYIAGLQNGISGDAGAALASLDVTDMRETAEVLTARGFSEVETADVFAVVASVLEAITTESLTLAANKYMTLRKPFVERSRDSGLHPWPADGQTIAKRLGLPDRFWSDAIANLGLTPQAGRARGLLVFTEAEYLEAVVHYRRDRAALGYKAQAAEYTAWRERELQGGRSRPSQPAIRGHFGSWQAAIRAAVDEPALNLEPKVRERFPGARLLHAARIDLDQGLRAFEEAATIGQKDAAVRDFVTSYAQSFEIDRRIWFRAMVSEDPEAGARRATQSKRDLKLHAQLVANPQDALAALTDVYLDRVLANGLGDVDGWFSDDVIAALAPLNAMTKRYEVLRSARNFITHGGKPAAERFRRAVEIYAEERADFAFTREVTATMLLRWLSAKSGARLRHLGEVLPAVWTTMVTAEGVLQAERELAGRIQPAAASAG